jgi:TM2 domain-containing membrane protein YozV
MNCSGCGYENRVGANYCQACGQPLQAYQGPGYTNPGYYYPPYQGYPYNYPQQFEEHKDVVVALLLSFMLPGAGHMYAGEVKKGLIILATFFILGIVLGLVIFATVSTAFLSSNPFSVAVVVIIGIVIAVVIWLYQMYDAYKTALRFNASHGLKRF